MILTINETFYNNEDSDLEQVINTILKVNKESFAEVESYSLVSFSGSSGTYTANIECLAGDIGLHHQFTLSGSDLAGNVNKIDGMQVPKTTEQFVVDNIKPEITSVVWSQGKDYKDYIKMGEGTARSATITINEHNFYGDGITLKYDFSDYNRNVTKDIKIPCSSWEDYGDDIHTFTCSFNQEGDYEFSISGYDIPRNSLAQEGGDTFTLDYTAPRIDVSFDNNNAVNGKYFTSGRTASLTVYERNFSASFADEGHFINAVPESLPSNDGSVAPNPQFSGWSDNADGTVHSATAAFQTEGTFILLVDGFDLAGWELNPSYTSGEFVID